MFLCIDIGNSHLHGGFFIDKNLIFQFRYPSNQIGSSDQLGIFFRNIFRENNMDYTKIKKIAIASVVPNIDYTIRAACIKYLQIDPLFIKSDMASNLNIKINHTQELGSDFFVAGVAAINLSELSETYIHHKHNNTLIFDLGTASKVSYIDNEYNFLGGAITAGMKLTMESLSKGTSSLFNVELIHSDNIINTNTSSALQAGIYYSQLGFINETIKNVTLRYKLKEKPTVIATGGFSGLFLNEKIFDYNIPELLLLGIRYFL